MQTGEWLGACFSILDQYTARQAREEFLTNTILVPADSADNYTFCDRRRKKSLQALIRKLVIYIRYGCTNGKCDNRICFSCVRRAADGPVRRPTLLTARCTAYALADRPDVSELLCHGPPLIDLRQLENTIENLRRHPHLDLASLIVTYGAGSVWADKVISGPIDLASNDGFNIRCLANDEFRSNNALRARGGPATHNNPLVDYIQWSQEPEKKDRKSLAQNLFDTSVYKGMEWASFDDDKCDSPQAALSSLSPASLAGLGAMVQYHDRMPEVEQGSDGPSSDSDINDRLEEARSQRAQEHRAQSFVKASLHRNLHCLQNLMTSFSDLRGCNQSTLRPVREATIEAFSYWPEELSVIMIQSLSHALEVFGRFSKGGSPLPEDALHLLTICMYALLGLARRSETSGFDLARGGGRVQDAINEENRYHMDPVIRLLRQVMKTFAPYHNTSESIVRVLAPHGPDSLESLPDDADHVVHHRHVLSFIGLIKTMANEDIGSSPLIDTIALEVAMDCLRRLLDWYCTNHRYPVFANIQLKPEMRMPLVMARIEPVQMVSSYTFLPVEAIRRHLLHHTFLFTSEYLATCFRAMSYIRLKESFSAAIYQVALQHRAGPNLDIFWQNYLEGRLAPARTKYLVLQVNRETLLEDTLNQLWGKEHRELMRPFKVLIGGEYQEMGDDHGGPTREFFRFVFERAFHPDAGLFIIDEDSGMPWFDPTSREPLATYEVLGLLVSLALHNGIHAPINLPVIFYKMLLQPKSLASGAVYAMGDLADGWPRLHSSFTQLLQWEEGNVGDVFSRDYAFSVRDCDRVIDINLDQIDHANFRWDAALNREDYPAHQPAPLVTNKNRHSFVNDYTKFLLVSSIRPQLEAFTKGLKTCLDPRSLHIVTPPLLKTITEGDPHIDMPAIRGIATYKNGFTAASIQIQLFWAIVLAWPAERQRSLLEFVTANDRVPVLGTRSMQFVVERTGEDPDHLPSSQTCFSTLKMPDYGADAALMRGKLETVLAFGARGFGVG